LIAHHLHGSKQKRRSYERWKILRDNDLNPFTAIAKDWQGIYQWTGAKPRLRDAVRRYFVKRNEEIAICMAREAFGQTVKEPDDA
jgi:hypothetical protein